MPVYSGLNPTLSIRSRTTSVSPSTTLHTSSIHLNLVTSGSAVGTRQHLNQNQSEAVLHPRFLSLHLIRAGIGSLPKLTVATGRVLIVHLQTFPPLILFRLRVGKLRFYLDWVNVSVEVAHNGKDDAHHHQQRGKQDVLGPLVNKSTQARLD